MRLVQQHGGEREVDGRLGVFARCELHSCITLGIRRRFRMAGQHFLSLGWFCNAIGALLLAAW